MKTRNIKTLTVSTIVNIMNDLKKKPLFRIRIILQLLSCLCILFCAKDPEPVLMIDLRDDLKLKGTLSGTVTDINGKPLSAVSVTLEGTDNSTLSLPDGTFKIPNVASGLYTLVFRHYSYKDTTLKSIAISTNQNLIISDTIEMKSSKAKLTGRTVSNKQKAVPGAGLTVTYQPYQTLSGDSGFFSFPELISGQINIVAAYRGIGWGEKKLSLQPGDSADISITLDNEGGSIRGRVIGADNNPVKNKIVSTMNGAISD
ncbi:MAG: hypothetical protein GX640_03880, partial [Fibrobacter sp.]|nr:hypothetical protein [Fibrobacter sp.]